MEVGFTMSFVGVYFTQESLCSHCLFETEINVYSQGFNRSLQIMTMIKQNRLIFKIVILKNSLHPQFFLGSVCVAHLFSFLCCVFFCFLLLFVFILHLVCPMLPVSLDCPFLIAPSVFSNIVFYFVLFCI